MLGLSEDKAGGRDPSKSETVRSVIPRVGGGSGGDFEQSPIDLSEIGRAYYSDSYIMRAIDKIVGLMFKSGWNFNSSNSEALEYVKQRFELISEGTETSVQELIREFGFNYVLYANSALLKVRGTDNLEGLEATGYYDNDPIIGLFNIPIERFEIQRDEEGNIEEYLVLGDSGDDLEIPPQDLLHITHNRPTGRAFGVPHISSVVDDVLILRQIEENIVRMIYRNIHPLITYTVGLAEPGYEATDEEIDRIAAQIQEMPLDSILVLSERHKVQTVSNESGILDAFNYLRYFRQRVFTGLGVSESTMGIGDSSNRSTSDNQSSDLIDLVKDFQINFQSGVQILVNEILFEGGFDPTMNEEDKVQFEFVEIEQSVKIARENHELMKYLSNAQSLDRYLENIGEDPIDDSEIERFYKNLFDTSSDTNSKGSVDNKNQPENQHGKQDGPVDNPKEMVEYKKKDNSSLTIPSDKVNLTIDSEKSRYSPEEIEEGISVLFSMEDEDLSNEDILNDWVASIPENSFGDEIEREAFISTAKIGLKLKDSLDKDMHWLLEEAIVRNYHHLKGGKN